MRNMVFYRSLIRTVIALIISVVIYRMFSIEHGFWVTLTTAIVLQATTGATLRRGVQRLIGTYIGILVGGLLLHFLHLSWQFELMVVLFSFLAFYFRAFNAVNYSVFVIPLTAMVFMLLSLVFPDQVVHLMWVRMIDSTLGALIAVIVSLTILPFSQATLVRKAKIHTINMAHQAVQKGPFSVETLTELSAINQKYQQCLRTNRLLFSDAVYEFLFNHSCWKKHRQFITQAEKVGQLLLGYEAVLSFNCASLNQRYSNQVSADVHLLNQDND